MKQFMCATDNVMALSQFIILKPAVEPSADRSIRRFYETGSLHALSTADWACLPKSFYATSHSTSKEFGPVCLKNSRTIPRFPIVVDALSTTTQASWSTMAQLRL